MINKILLVDDETSFLSGFARALSRVCHFNGEIRTSTTGTDAIKEIGSDHIDLCFLDVNLPDMCGIDVMKKIKEVSPDTRVVIMTASVLDDDMKCDIDKDANLFIPKPLELDMVRDFLNREQEAESESRLSETSPPNPLNEEKRAHERMPCSKTVKYSISIFYDFQLRSDLTAEITDISQGGAGLSTCFAATTGNVITFTEGLPNKKGIVRWWGRNEQKYRVGVKFL